MGSWQRSRADKIPDQRRADLQGTGNRFECEEITVDFFFFISNF